MIGVQLNLRLTESQNVNVPLEVNASDRLEVIRTEAAKQGNVAPSDVLLLFCGGLLNDTETVEEAGFAAGDCVHCIKTKPPLIDEAAPLSTIEVHELHRDLSRLIKSKTRHQFFAHVQQSREFTNKALAAVAGSWRDPDAALLLLDPVLIYNFCKDTPEVLGSVCSDRPVLGRLLQHLVSVFRKEGPWKTPSAASQPVPAAAFSLDALYEQEEDDHYPPRSRSGEASGSGSSASGSAQASLFPSLPAITPAQLAAALANATGSGIGRGIPHLPSLQPPHRGGHPSIPATPSNTPASHTSASTSHTSASTSASHTPASASASTPHQQQEAGGQSLPSITSEMLNSALQSVLGAAAVGGGGTSPSAASPLLGGSSSATPNPPTAPVNIPNLEESVRLMAEMGIPDEALSRQALHMTNGDVQAAVELVFAQLNMFD